MNNLQKWLIKLIFGLGVSELAVVYATLVIKGKKTLEQVPASIRKEVEELLSALEVTVK